MVNDLITARVRLIFKGGRNGNNGTFCTSVGASQNLKKAIT